MAEPGYEASGDGEPVLFVPGFPFGVHALRRLIPLAAARFRVVVPDVTELAGSEARAAGLRDLLEELGIERCAVRRSE